MVIYTIKDIEEITGIKAHTLRIWEKRYGIIKPQRTATNIRFYSEKELKNILNISFLNKNGFKISQISSFSADQIKEEISKLSNIEDQVDKQLDALSIAVINLDGKTINIILDKYISKLGFEKTMDLLINPFLEKLSAFWLTNTVKSVHESFISEILRQRTIIELHKLKPAEKDARVVMLYLGENEKQQLSIMFLSYLLKLKGINAVLAGFDLSIIDVLDAYHIIKPDYLYTIINEEPGNSSFDTYVNYICKTITPIKLVASGFLTLSNPNKIPENFIALNDLNSAIDFLTN